MMMIVTDGGGCFSSTLRAVPGFDVGFVISITLTAHPNKGARELSSVLLFFGGLRREAKLTACVNGIR